MQRISTSTKATDLYGAGKHGFKDGNQSLGIVPTDLEAAWFNQVQEEIANTIEAAGITLNPANRTQLLEAIGKLTMESGTKTVFFQAAAPTGWTQITAHNNKALRIVSGAGGGSVAFTTAFASHTPAGTVGNTTLSSAQMPSHVHQTGADAGGTGGSVPYGPNSATAMSKNTTAVGGGDSHNHSFTGTAINLAVQYIDMILASRN